MTLFRLATSSLCAVLWLSLTAGCGGDDDGTNPGADAGVDAPLGAPVVTITSHGDDQRIIGSRTITLAGTLADPDTITAVTVTVDGGAPVTATFDQTSFSAQVPLGDNTSTVRVTATDETTASGSADVTLVYPFIALTSFQAASMVLGQPDMTTGDARATDAARIQWPYGKLTDVGGVLFASDYRGQRVLGFRGFPAADNAAADFALGQTSLTSSLEGIAADRFDGPQTVAEHDGRLYVADYANARIMVWSSIPTTTGAPATTVIGQNDLTSVVRTCTATRFAGVEDFMIAGGKLVVADSDNNRILIWSTVPAGPNIPADIVLGQADFARCAENDDDQDGAGDAAPTARTLAYPSAAWSDGTRLVVVDADNQRVLIWSTFPATSFAAPDVILEGFDYPYGVTSNGNQLFVADMEGSRVLVWNSFPTANVPADVVLGQSDLTRSAANDDDQDGVADDSPSARTLAYPASVSLVRDRLLVSDTDNSRVLVFGDPICTVNAGLYEYPVGSGTCIDDPCEPAACTNLRTCDRSTGVAVCTCPAGIEGDCDTCVRRVDADATGAGTGLSWADAYTTLPPALASAAAVEIACEVWVAEGTYYAYSTSDADSFVLAGSVNVRGGFAGNETTAATRAGGATILDGRDAGGTNDVRHVVSSISSGGASPPALDRVTVRYGNADGTANDGRGGGVLVNSSARLRITDSIIENNRSTLDGAGLFSGAAGTSAVTLTNTIIRTNTSGTSGGGAVLNGGTITGCTFEGNRAGSGVGHAGGGVTLQGTGTVTGSTFRRNWAGGDAGGVWIKNPSTSWTIANSTIESNEGTNGGGIYFDATGATSALSSSVVIGNVARTNAGGVFVRDSNPAITNVTVAGNVSAQGYGGIGNAGSSGAYANLIAWGNASDGGNPQMNTNGETVTYSDIGGGHAGTGNIDSAPLFVNAPAQIDRVVAQVTADAITVSTGARFAVGDRIEIGNDGTAREITAVVGNLLTFTPVLAASPLDIVVENWGSTTPASLVADYHLATGSPCIDTGTPAGTNMGAYP